jgi:predicted lipoprotein with Yx(FWY)xxD motif
MRKFLAMGVVAAFLLAACGGKSNSNGSAAGSGSSPSGGATGAATVTVNTGTASGVGTVLVNAQGLTLYHWKGETTSSLKCTGSTCLSTWLIAKVAGGGAPSGGMHVTGKLATFSRSDGAGTQVTYNGMPLYTYTGDSSPGQANGQGLFGVWFAVTPTMTATSTGSSGGGYGGGGYGGGGYSP